MNSRTLSRFPTRMRGGWRPAAMSASCFANDGAMKSAAWPGPMWLQGRAVIR